MKKYLVLLLLFFVLTWCGNKNVSSNKNIEDNKKQEIVKQDEDLQKVSNFEKKELNNDDIEIDNENTDNNENISDNNANDNVIITADNKSNSQTNIDKLDQQNNKFKKLSDFNLETLKSARECLKLHLTRKDKIFCVKQVENRFLNEALTINDCKKLSLRSYKRKCLDKIYFLLATDKKKLSYCSFIKDISKQNKCKNDIKTYLFSIKKQQEQEKKQEEEKKAALSVSDISSCNKLQWDDKLICIDKFVKQDHDLRYCNKLSKNFQLKCKNDNWNSVLKYNLMQAVKTKDKSYCDKIWDKNWIARCYAGIK